MTTAKLRTRAVVGVAHRSWRRDHLLQNCGLGKIHAANGRSAADPVGALHCRHADRHQASASQIVSGDMSKRGNVTGSMTGRESVNMIVHDTVNVITKQIATAIVLVKAGPIPAGRPLGTASMTASIHDMLMAGESSHQGETIDETIGETIGETTGEAEMRGAGVDPSWQILSSRGASKIGLPLC